MTEQKRPAVLLDRDGTLNVEVNYLHRKKNFEWIDGAPEAVKRLKKLGFLVIVITNQAGVAHGYYEEQAIKEMHSHIQAELSEYNTEIDDFYYCPYHPEAEVKKYLKESMFRKPEPGMYRKAISDWKIDVKKSFVVGDKETDLIPGNRLGISTIKVETGHKEENSETVANYTVEDVLEASRLIQNKI